MEEIRAMSEDEIRARRAQWRKERGNTPINEFITCIDALTGKTLWQRVYEGHGKLMLDSGKGGGHYTMCVHDGKAYAFGSGGWIYCFDAVTGETVWEGHKHPEMHSPNATPMIADGVLIYRAGSTIVGYDAATGEQLWSKGGMQEGTRSSACTRVWRVDGRELFVHEGHCFVPRSGETLWEIPVHRSAGNQTVIQGSYLVTSGPTKKKHEAPRCFRISPQGYEQIWEMDPTKYRTKGFSSHCFNDGHVFIDLKAPDKIPGKDKRHWYFAVVDVESGERQVIEGRYKGWKYQPIIAEGRYIYFGGYDCWMLNADPEDFREISYEEVSGFARDCSPAYACGLMYLRERERIVCYDFRRDG